MPAGGSKKRRDERARGMQDAANAKQAKKDTGVPKLDTLLTMPSLSSASVAAAEEESLRKQAKRGGRASTLLSDPNEQPLAARDVVTETASAGRESDRLRAEEFKLEQAKKKKLIAMGLYTAPTTVLGG